MRKLIYCFLSEHTLTGCSNTQTASITLKPLPVLSLQGNTIICEAKPFS